MPNHHASVALLILVSIDQDRLRSDFLAGTQCCIGKCHLCRLPKAASNPTFPLAITKYFSSPQPTQTRGQAHFFFLRDSARRQRHDVGVPPHSMRAAKVTSYTCIAQPCIYASRKIRRGGGSVIVYSCRMPGGQCLNPSYGSCFFFFFVQSDDDNGASGEPGDATGKAPATH